MSTSLADLYQIHFNRQIEFYQQYLETHSLSRVILDFGKLQHAFRDDQELSYRANPYALFLVNLSNAAGSFIEIDKTGKVTFYHLNANSFWVSYIDYQLDFFKQFFEIIAIDSQFIPKLNDAVVISPQGENFIEAKQVNPHDLLLDLETLRRVKTGYEIELLQLAQINAIQAHQHLKNYIDNQLAGRPSFSENDLLAYYLKQTNTQFDEQGYSGIFGLNEHGATLHHNRLDHQAPMQYRSFLVDAGAVHQGYHADITRTYCLDDNQLFTDLVDGVTEIKLDLIAYIKPGITTVETQDKCLDLVTSLLIDSGLVKGQAAEYADHELAKAFMPHGFGHSLGINVHDPIGRSNVTRPENCKIRSILQFEVGNVFTVEPGVYFIDSLIYPLKDNARYKDAIDWQLYEVLKPYGGIRSEDNIYLGEDHLENLTSGLAG